MKIKLILSTETKDTEKWIDMPFIPRKDEWVEVAPFLTKEEIITILHSARCWSGLRGSVQSIEYKYDNNNFYPEMYVWCED